MVAKGRGIYEDINLTLDKTTDIQDNERDQSIINEHSDLLNLENRRYVRIFDNKDKIKVWEKDKNKKENQPRGTLDEHILFWPSAPIYALGWPRVYPIKEHIRTAWHTMRLLKRPGHKTIDRISLLSDY